MSMEKTDLRFLADVNLEKSIVEFIRKKVYDIKWIVDIDLHLTDFSICDLATREKRVILTNDKDFGEIAFFQKRNVYGIILLRIKGQNAEEKSVLLEKLFNQYGDKIREHFVIITKTKYRFIPIEGL